MSDSFDLDFEDITITLNDGFPIGRFDGTAEIDQDGAILSLTFTHKPKLGVQQHRTLKVVHNMAVLDTWDFRLALVLADEIASQMKDDIEEALREWRDDCRPGREY